jgi:hypothetical protein
VAFKKQNGIVKPGRWFIFAEPISDARMVFSLQQRVSQKTFLNFFYFFFALFMSIL